MNSHRTMTFGSGGQGLLVDLSLTDPSRRVKNSALAELPEPENWTCQPNTALPPQCWGGAPPLPCSAPDTLHPGTPLPQSHACGVLWERKSVWKVGFMIQGMVRVPEGAEKTVGIHSDQCPLYLLQDKDPGGSRCRQVINTRPQIPGLPGLYLNTQRKV